MDNRTVKHLLYEQVARIGRAVSSPKRLELLELLAQSDKTVEELAGELSVDVKLTSAHLKALREARLVTVRRQGKYMVYRLSGEDVAALWVALREVAEEHLLELQLQLDRMARDPGALASVTRKALLKQARRGEIVMIDVRPEAEFETAHLPFARSMPLAELKRRLAELPKSRQIVAYCRGPFCMLAGEAVKILQGRGFRARKLADGISEWRAAGMRLESAATD
ncbi:MAG: metalloregulator ArsR/SmtB family transcription factor [Burkholderiales bacterium]|jgi:rhodanese-related sulfurtransferase/DNA-binding transcriptional ArsR family regulator|nr:metalloregulator ArsR/SmtB family transcription factor [Burkholderiales bacterium]